MIGSERGNANANGTELANGTETETGTAEDPVAATKVEDRGIIGAVAGTSFTEIGAEIVIAIEIDIETGEETRKHERDLFAIDTIFYINHLEFAATYAYR